MSGGLYQVKVFELKDIEEYYNNITILKNEDGIDELAFKNFQNATRDSVYKSDIPNNKIYCTSVKRNKRYINPLVDVNNTKVSRIRDIPTLANNDISNFLNMKFHNFIGFNFDFKPYNQ